METNPDGQLAPKQVVGIDYKSISNATIVVSVCVVIVVLALIGYCIYFGIAIDFNRIFDIFDRRG